MKGLQDWDTKHERSQEKPSATLILVHSSSLSLGLCSERAPMSQLGQGAPRGYPRVPETGNTVRHGANTGSGSPKLLLLSVMEIPSCSSASELFLCQWPGSSSHPVTAQPPLHGERSVTQGFAHIKGAGLGLFPCARPQTQPNRIRRPKPQPERCSCCRGSASRAPTLGFYQIN